MTDTVSSQNTEENLKKVAAAKSLFGIRPGVRLTIIPEPFLALPEAERPAFEFEYMTATAMHEYTTRLTDLIGDLNPDLPKEERHAAIMTALQSKRKEQAENLKWVIRKHLKAIHRYPSKVGGGFVECKLEADGTLSEETWDAINTDLRPIIGEEFVSANFPSDTEASGVKS